MEVIPTLPDHPWHSMATKGMSLAQYVCGEIYQPSILSLYS